MQRGRPRPAPAQAAAPAVVLALPLQDYLDYAAGQKRLAARTLAIYTDALRQLQALAEQSGVALLQTEPSHVRRWVAALHAQGRHGRSIALWLSCWRGFFQWAAWQGWVAHNPVTGVRAPKSPQPLPKALDVDEAVHLAVWEPAATSAWDAARDAAMTELLYSSGLRVGELTQLDVHASAQRGWVDLQAALVHVLGKGGKRRSVPVGAPALQALQHWLLLRSQPFAVHWQHEALFVGVRGARITAQMVWQRLRLRSQQAGLPQAVHPHMLRHAFASHVLQSSGNLRAVQELLGHASIRTTQVYTRLDFQHLSQAYTLAHPRAKRCADSEE